MRTTRRIRSRPCRAAGSGPGRKIGLACAAAASLLAGCAAPPAPRAASPASHVEPSAEARRVETLGGGAATVVQSSEEPTRTTLPAEWVYPRGPGRLAFLDEDGRRIVRTASAPDARGEWTLAELGAEGPRQTLTLADEPGGVALLGLDVPADGGRRRRFAFAPGLVLLPRALSDGEEHAARTRFTEVDGRSGEALAAARARRDDAGGWIVEVRIVLDLPPAQVVRASTTALEADGRVRAVESERTVRVFGIVAEREQARLRAE